MKRIDSKKKLNNENLGESYVFLDNIESFINKWGLKKLKSSEKSWKDRIVINSARYLGLAAATSTILDFIWGRYVINWGIMAICPLSQILVSKMEERIKNKEENKWREFLDDANKFLSNYNELLEIINNVENIMSLEGEEGKYGEEIIKIRETTNATEIEYLKISISDVVRNNAEEETKHEDYDKLTLEEKIKLTERTLLDCYWWMDGRKSGSLKCMVEIPSK